MSVEVGAGLGGTVIATVGSPRTFTSGEVVTMLELYSGFGRCDMVGILNQQSGAVSYARPECDAPVELTGNESRSYIITKEVTATCFSPFQYRLGRKCNVPHAK